MDNAPYHTMQSDKVPNKSLSKKYMIDWRRKNTSGNMLSPLEQLLNEACDFCRPSDWKRYNKLVIKIESEYWVKDGIIEDAVDEMIIQLRKDSECDDSSSLSDVEIGYSTGDDEEMSSCEKVAEKDN
ncbi:hypothetical protein J6590_058001 [Homalodisca vitripennis]|nr:hypothetical protein J6590_058001 [Homalodisca vitripennis]